jgi:hypothetical protein
MRVVAYYLTRGKSVTRQRARVNGEIIAEYVDEGYGTGRQEWPVLEQACKHAKRHRAKVAIAQLGKLKYNLAFLRTLEGVDFVTDESLGPDTLDQQIIDTQERSMWLANMMRDRASKHTGFAVKHHRQSVECVAGALLGAQRAAEVRKQRAVTAYQFLIPRVRQYRKTMTWDEIVTLLKGEGQLTMAGMPFNRPTLIRIMQRAAKK